MLEEEPVKALLDEDRLGPVCVEDCFRFRKPIRSLKAVHDLHGFPSLSYTILLVCGLGISEGFASTSSTFLGLLD